VRPYLENTQHNKRAEGVTQVVERLPTKGEFLSSNPRTRKKKALQDSVCSHVGGLGNEHIPGPEQ
jgi:hypothetical protein